MAEAVLFDLATKVLEHGGSSIFSKIQLVRGVSDELNGFKNTVRTIQAGLLDAEKRRWSSDQGDQGDQVKLWLLRLKDVLYDAQDLLDDVATEDLRRKVTPGNKTWNAVRVFFSQSNQLAQSYKVAKKIQELKKTLDQIANDNKFSFEPRPREETMAIGRGKKTEYFTPARVIIGREEDKKKIKRLLFDSSSSQSVSFVAIVGEGGLGKTALALLVYDDGEVKEYFKLKMWVSVSDVFDVNLIIKQILKSAGCDLDLDNKPKLELLSLLHETLSGKIFLLVLDDLWNESRFEWSDLGECLKDGLPGSKILVTTRSHKVATVPDGKPDIHALDGLSEGNSWDLLRKMAFGEGLEPLDPKLEEIGRDIVKKCAGIPLAIKTIGGLLHDKKKGEWLRYKLHEFSKIPEIDSVNGGIMEVLQFSYDRLPSCLKHCFAYCSLFPKGYVYQKDTMIHLWVAQGFIESKKDNLVDNLEDNLEEVASDYLSLLICRSFLEVESIVKHGNGNEVDKFKMHDLMHDLAQKVAGGECKIIDFKGGDNDTGIRHASFISETFSEEKVQFLLKTSKLRTFLSLKGESSVHNCHKVYSSCGHCRALYLDNTNIPLPPSSLGKLKQLRFLHISMNESIRSLPDSITNLVNLQTLKLSCCMHLQKFPRDLRKLVKLRHLLIESCDSLSQLPPLSELPSLKTLCLNSLHALKFVQQTSDPKPSNTTLPFFQSLESLEVSCCGELEGWWGTMREMGAHQKHRSDNSWPSFPKLRYVNIFAVPNLSFIPSFPQVEYLIIHDINLLEQQLMANPNCPLEGTMEATSIPFRKLRYLNFGSCGGNPEPIMLKPLLQLASNLECMIFTSFDLRILTREMQHLSLLKELCIWDCHRINLYCQEDEHVTQWECLTNLRVLTIANISNLVALPNGIQHVKTLQSLHLLILPNLRCLPEWIGNFPELEELELYGCVRLRHIPSEIRNLTSLRKLRIDGSPILDPNCLDDMRIPIIVRGNRSLFGGTAHCSG